MLDTFFTGAFLGAGLIIAIGAQNAFILSLGLKRLHAIKAALVCALSDALLILAGVAGLGGWIATNSTATTIAALGGAAFLVAYAIFALRRALKPTALEAQQTHRTPWPTILAQTLAVTFLNPHVYLDTVVLLGSISAQYSEAARPIFAAGATSASFVWFLTLATGATLLAPYLARPSTWRIIDALTATVMLVIAWQLLQPFLG
jgi:L-lysine exporter family protein LysE/ArgO